MSKSKNSEALNAVERAYTLIFNKTVNFGFLPGERINEVELAESLGMSRAPVREALNRLVAKNLVLFESGKGFFCRKLSTNEVAELFELRADLEMAGARSACKKASDDAIKVFVKKWLNYGYVLENYDKHALIDADETFHLDLASLAQNKERLKILESINDRIRFVRCIRIESLTAHRTFIEDHNQIVEALSQRNADMIVKVMEGHFAHNGESLQKHIHEGLVRIFADEVV